MSAVSGVAPAAARSGRAAAPGEQGLPRLLPAVRQDLAAHERRHGRLRYRGPELLEHVRAAGLTGRGGAAFLVARKLAAVSAAGPDPVVVGNAAEGEPASSKDAALLWLAPHLVLDGLQLAADAVRARTVYLYLQSGHHAAGGIDLAAHLRAAMADRQAAASDRIVVRVVDAPARFLAGEETALVSRINGRTARPAFKQHRVFERGIGGRPTLVQNVETLAHLALIARHGPAWFRTVGTADEPGSMLCTVREADGSARIVEAALGSPLGTLLRLGPEVRAVLAGGYHGGWLSIGSARQASLCNASLRPAGTTIGAGILAALPAEYCGLAETARVARFLALESAGQCGPCFNGLPAIAAALAAVARPRPAAGELTNLRRWAEVVTGRGACHHPDGTVRFVASSLVAFADEIAEHSRGRCTATRHDPFLPLPATARAEADWR